MPLKWNPDQRKIDQLLKEGKPFDDIVKTLGVSLPLVYKVNDALKAGEKPPEIPVIPSVAPPPVGDKPPPAGTPLRTALEVARSKPPPKPPAAKGDKKEEPKVVLTTEPLEAIALKLMTKTMVIYQTPQILFSYLCAVNRGFDVDLAEWITIACDDVWSGRNINYFEEVGLKKKVRRNGDGERQDQGATETAGAEGE